LLVALRDIVATEQGHSVFVQGLHNRLQEEIKGCVSGEALLAQHPSHASQPSPKVEPDDSTSPSAHRSVRCDTRLSSAAWQTPFCNGHLRAGVLCDVMWGAQL